MEKMEAGTDGRMDGTIKGLNGRYVGTGWLRQRGRKEEMMEDRTDVETSRRTDQGHDEGEEGGENKRMNGRRD